MIECVCVSTYRRDEMLHGCLRRLRGQDGDIPIFVFHDRGETGAETENICDEFEAQLIVQPKHEYRGNSFSVGEALRFAYNMGCELIHHVEDDCFVKPGFFDWTHDQHELFSDIFASCAWVGNQVMDIADVAYYVPWLYIPQFSMRREMLKRVLPHLNHIYYKNMARYCRETFPDNVLYKMHNMMNHYEIDGLLQHILLRDGLQVAWNGIAHSKHLGMHGYNRGGYGAYREFFGEEKSFAKRVARMEEFASDPQWRMQFFSREIVEREEGHVIEERTYRYRMIQGEYESEFTSPLLPQQLPRLINSVPRTAETVIECI